MFVLLISIVFFYVADKYHAKTTIGRNSPLILVIGILFVVIWWGFIAGYLI